MPDSIEFDFVKKDETPVPIKTFVGTSKEMWEFDWDKINTVEDLKQLLKGIDMYPMPNAPNWENLKPYCKLKENNI